MIKLNYAIKNITKCCVRYIVSVANPKNGDGIGVLSISASPVNALTKDIFEEITRSIDNLECDPNCHALIITSSCKVFSSGMDLKKFNNASKTSLVGFWYAFQDLQRKIRNTRLFTVAGINGHAIAGGCILSLCCDERVISHDAKIGLNEVTFGLVPPDFASALMAETVGSRQAYKAVTLGKMFTAGMIIVLVQ